MGSYADFVRQSRNPAIPEGGRQAARAGAGYRGNDPRYAGSSYARYVAQDGYAKQSTSWYTGANAANTGNGWETGFFKTAMRQYDEALKQMKDNPNALKDWFKRDDAYGVVTWGRRREKGDPDTALRFGDVYQSGRRVANVYDDFDKRDADVVMAPWIIDGKTQQKIFADPDREAYLAGELEDRRVQRTKIVEQGTGSREFQRQVDIEQEKQQGRGVGAFLAGLAGAATGGLAAGGAAAAAGSWTGPGVVPLAVGGFLFGTGAALLNQDQLTELSARATVQANMADKEFGKLQGASTWLGGMGQLGQRLLNPVSNLNQGLADWQMGEIGDSKEEFYAINPKTGQRKAPGIVQGLDLAATVTDAFLQFSNPVGVGLYTASMASHIVGDTTTLATTGESFNLRSGQFEDHEGFKENMSAALNIGIDVVQLGMVRGITQAGKQMRDFGVGPRAEVGSHKGLSAYNQAKANMQDRLPLWAGGVPKGYESRILEGSRYVVDPVTNVAIHKGFSLASLAPSEFLRATSNRLRTRIKGPNQSRIVKEQRDETLGKARQEMGLIADDYYKSAVTLASGRGSRFQMSLVNGFGEGGEEFAQALLEPWSHSEPINWRSAAESFAYGAATGVGMGLGATMGAPPQARLLWQRALAKNMFTEEEMPLAEFEALPVDTQKFMAEMSEDDIDKTNKAKTGLEEALTIRTMNASTMGWYAVLPGAVSEFERIASTANANIGGLKKISAFSNPDITDPEGNLIGYSTPAHGAKMTAWSAVDEVRRNVRALQGHKETLSGELAGIAEALADTTQPPERIDELQKMEARLQQQLADAELGVLYGDQFLETLIGLHQVVQQGTREEADSAVDEMNRILGEIYEGEFQSDGQRMTDDQVIAARLAGTVFKARDPILGEGSFVRLQIVVDRGMIRDIADGVIEIHQSLLEAPHADHDGDMIRAQRDKMLDRKSLARLSSGEQYLVPIQEEDPVSGRIVNKWQVRIAAPAAEASLLDQLVRSLNDSREAVRETAEGSLTQLGQILWNRYKDIAPNQFRLLQILRQFDTDLRGGDVKARNTFMDALATEMATEIQTELARQRGAAPEWPWLSQQITAKLNQVQLGYASNDPEYEYEAGTYEPVDDSVYGTFNRENHLIEGANLAATMQLVRDGVSSTRGAQAAHHNAYKSAVEALQAREPVAPELFYQLVEFFAGRSGRVTQSALDEIANRDATTRRVFEDLQAILRESGVDYGQHNGLALLMLAMTKIQDVDVQPKDDDTLPQPDVTLLQMLLRRSVKIDRVAIERVGGDEQAEAKLDALEALTHPQNNDGGHSTAAQEAAFEVFADMEAYELIGKQAQYIGFQTTLRGLRRGMLDMTRDARMRKLEGYKLKAPYLKRNERSNPPYTQEEIATGKLHPYTIFVDMLEASTNKFAPRVTQQSERAMDTFISGMAKLQSAVPDYARTLTPAERNAFEGLEFGEQVMQMINSNDRLARSAGAIIPGAVVRGAFTLGEKTGEIYAAGWVHDMFGMDPNEALMHYWRMTRLLEYDLANEVDPDIAAEKLKNVAEADVDEAKRGMQGARIWSKLETKGARQMYRVASTDDGMLLNLYMRELWDATDLREFRDDVLNRPEFNGELGPIDPLVEDVTDFDDSYQSSWQARYPGAKQREAVSKFAQAASTYSRNLAHARSLAETETRIAGWIEDYALNLSGTPTRINDQGEFYGNQLIRLIENSQTVQSSMGPTARDNALAVTQSGLVDDSKKGQADPAFAPFGAARVLAEGGGSKASILRAFSDVTAWDEEEIYKDPSRMATQAMRIQLENGKIIEWDAPEQKNIGPKSALLQWARLLKDPATASFAKRVLATTVYDVDQSNQLQISTYSDATTPDQRHSLIDLLKKADYSHIVPEPGGRLTTAQAHELISVVEGGVFKKVYDMDVEDQAQGFYPIQMMLQEVLTAYTHSSSQALDNGTAAVQRDEAVRAVAETLLIFGDLYSKNEVWAEAVKRGLEEKLTKRFGTRNAPSIMNIAQSTQDRVQLLSEIASARMESANRQQEKLNNDLANATNSADRKKIVAKKKKLADETKAYADALAQDLDKAKPRSVLAMFTISQTDEAIAIEQKKHILQFLAKSRIKSFRAEESELWQAVRTGLASRQFALTGTIDEDLLPEGGWDVLSRAAATAYLSERAGVVGAPIAQRMLEADADEWNDLARYFDHTWSSLLDHITKGPVLETLKFIQSRNRYSMNLDVPAAVDRIEQLLFNERNLGEWSPLVVRLNLTARNALLSSGVDMATAIPGILPQSMATLINATNYNYDIPPVPPTERVIRQGELDDFEIYSLLEGSFVKRNVAEDISGAMLTYTKRDGSTASIDLFDEPLLGDPWGDPNDTEQAKVFNSGYVAISAEGVQRAVDRAQLQMEDRNPAEPWTITFTMFDPAMRPADPAMAHNIFYTGIGRERERGSRDNVIASTMFGADGIHPVLTQMPLEAIKKVLAAFTPTTHINLADVMAIETSGDTIYRQLVAKAMLILSKKFDFGKLQTTDLPMVMEILRMRHEVQGENAEGETVTVPVDEAIALQIPPAEGEEAQVPLTNMRLVPLSEPLLNTLLGDELGFGRFQNGLDLNQHLGSAITRVDAELLERHGLTELGKPALDQYGNADFTGSKFRNMELPLTVQTARGRSTQRVAPWTPKVEVWRADQAKRLTIRKNMKYKTSKAKKEFEKHARKAFEVDAIASVMARAGLPQFGPLTEAQRSLAESYLSKMTARLEGSEFGASFIHLQGGDADPAKGILTQASFSMSDEEPGLPTFGDNVLIVLDMFEVMDTYDEQLKLAKEVLQFYTDRGVNLHLVNLNGGRIMREDLRLHLARKGEYKSMSDYSFVPILRNTELSQNSRALARKLIEDRAVSAETLITEFRSNQFTQANEQASHYNSDQGTGQWFLQRTNILSHRPDGFGAPVGDQRKFVRDQLLALLNTEAGFNHLVKQAGEGEGIVEALKRLQSTLQKNKLPTDNGEMFGFGYFDVLINEDNVIYLGRQGFHSLTDKKIPGKDGPDYNEVMHQAQTAVGETAPKATVEGTGIAVGPSRRDESLSSNVGIIKRSAPSELGGGRIWLEVDVNAIGAKALSEMDGMKHGLMPMPADLHFPGQPPARGHHIMIASNIVDGRDKEANFTVNDNMQTALLIYGANFKDWIFEYLTGAKPTSKSDLTIKWPAIEKQLRTIASSFNFNEAEIASALQDGSFFSTYTGLVRTTLADELGLESGDISWLIDRDTDADGITRFGQVFIASLMTEGVQLDHILGSMGIYDIADPSGQDHAWLYPDVFANALDDYTYPRLREMLFDTFNAKLPPPDADGTYPYRLMPNYDFVVRMTRDKVDPFTALGLTVQMREGEVAVGGGMSPSYVMEVMEEGNPDPVGHLWFDMADGEIHSISVVPEYQRKGLAAGMLRLAQDRAAATGIVAPVHSEILTEQGAAWAAATSSAGAGEYVYYVGEQKITDLKLDDKHPTLQVQSDESSTRDGVSLFGAAQSSVLFNAGVAHQRNFDAVDQYFSGERNLKFGEGEKSLWSRMQSLKDIDMPPLDKTAAERIWEDKAHRRHGLYHVPLDRSDWGRDAAEIERRMRALAKTYFGDSGMDAHIEHLIRMYPGARGIDSNIDTETDGVDTLAPGLVLRILTILEQNAAEGYFPLYGSEANPLIGLNTLKAIWRNRHSEKAWRPRKSGLPGSEAVEDSLASWINAQLGQMAESSASFNSIFRLDLDGAWLTYEGATQELMEIPSSLSQAVNLKLLDHDTQELVISLDPGQAAILKSVIGMEGTALTLESFINGEADYDRATTGKVPESEYAARLDRTEEWRKRSKLPTQKKMKVIDYVEEGAWYATRATGTHKILKGLTNLRIFMALFNPALMLAAIPESYVRNGLDNFISLLGGTAMTATGERLAGVGEKLGWDMLYSAEQRRDIRKLIDKLGNDKQFMAMIYDALMYHSQFVEPGDGSISRLLEKMARFSARMQDPSWGMFGKTIAKRYIETALAHIQYDPSQVVSVETLVANMNHDPLWLQKRSPVTEGESEVVAITPHSSGLNAVAHIRSVKTNIIGKAVGGIFSPLTEGQVGRNIIGHLIKWPMIFTNYTAGAAMFVSGTGIISDWVAAELHGRKSAAFGRFQAKLRGQPYNEETDGTFDMSDILEGLDLTRSFLRAGVTWSGYMTYMLMGGIGLSGEDPEAKRRRLLAAYYGMPVVYDPGETASQFRNGEFIDIEGLPGPLESLVKLVSRAEGGEDSTLIAPHWIMRQFISPIVGIERFMNTGDINQIHWGFTEAASVLPQSTLRMFYEGQQTFNDLAKMAGEEAGKSDPEAMNRVSRFLISALGVYERGFLESSFVNTIRNGQDKYDRDPWVQVRTDSRGQIEYDDNGNPLPTKALTSFTDKDAEGNRIVGQAYDNRSYWEAQDMQYAENNFTYSLLRNLFTGQGFTGTYSRKNMAVKQKNINLRGLSEDEATGLFLKALDFEGGAPELTLKEATAIARGQVHAQTGRWLYNNQLEGMALSIMDEANNREVLTKDGARVIFESLYAGTVDINSGSLAGIYIPYEMRQEIQANIIEDLIKEGKSWGMDDVSASARANRIWWGHDVDNPQQIGLRELVYSNEIPQKPTAAYNQLNTTFVLGPGGRPYATAVRRDSWLEALGINFVGTGAIMNRDGGMDVDAELNSIDNVLGINTGLRALERNEAQEIKPDDKALEKQLKKTYKANSGYGGGFGGGFGGFGGGGGGGYGGGGSYAPHINFSRMQPFMQQRAPYANGIPFINMSNPIIRRAETRRERVSSERGRLKQWQ